MSWLTSPFQAAKPAFLPSSQRKFVMTTTQRSNKTEFCVVTYNILADGPLYALSNYWVPEPLRLWSSRWPRLREELEKLDADIIGMQETNTETYQRDIGPDLAAMGFEGIHAIRDHEAEKGLPRFTEAFFYRKEIFEAKAVKTVRFSDMLDPYVEETGQTFARRFKACPDVCILALLQHRHTGKLVVVATTHLHFHPANSDLKTLQAFFMCRAVKQFQQQHEGAQEAPVIVIGDFNSLDNKQTADEFDPVIPVPQGMPSGVYELFTRGVLPPEHLQHPVGRASLSSLGFTLPIYPPPSPRAPSSSLPLSQPSGGEAKEEKKPNQPPDHDAREEQQQLLLGEWKTGLPPLQSAYLLAHGREPEFTNRTAKFSGCLDYIFFTPGLRLMSVLDLPFTSENVKDFPFLPNDLYPSDHLALGALFSFDS